MMINCQYLWTFRHRLSSHRDHHKSLSGILSITYCWTEPRSPSSYFFRIFFSTSSFCVTNTSAIWPVTRDSTLPNFVMCCCKVYVHRSFGVTSLSLISPDGLFHLFFVRNRMLQRGGGFLRGDHVDLRGRLRDLTCAITMTGDCYSQREAITIPCIMKAFAQLREHRERVTWYKLPRANRTCVVCVIVNDGHP